MADPLWTSDEAAKATGGHASGSWSVNDVSIDTRSLKPGALFVALKDVRDGHDFLDAAFDAGAAAALVSRDLLGQRPGLLVPDVLQGLEKLGVAARARTSGTCAAVTGSVGKTSVKEMLARIFRAVGHAHWSDKSFNNHWGVPLTLARMPRETERAIFEIGMNTPGEIAPRSRMVRPQIAMVTKIAGAHLEGMGTIEAVAEEKSQIFAGLEAGGAAILPAKDRFFDYLKAAALRLQPSAEILDFGGAPSKTGAAPVEYATDGVTSRVRVDVMGDVVDVTINAVGEHWAANVALALLAATMTGVAPRTAAEALSGYAPPAGRGVAETLNLPGGGTFTLIDDSYNANPESMRAAISGFASRPGRRIVALGEMRELGAASAELHASLAGPIVAAGVAAAVLSGPGMAPLGKELSSRHGAIRVECVDGAAQAADVVRKWLMPGDAVLIKGSNASGMARVGTALRKLSESVAKPQKAGGASDAV
ncbi:MAG: UDP-N-acetylmuramoyl-tripeptide--D-alanyl-D-alanine ligase [Alphaproteobacteria bacterium]|nr:UDP-N-acetylmuramoyl-tripeptide--D-alanyl-D-alanine ligase [Alphaproteobacteria bacterium]